MRQEPIRLSQGGRDQKSVERVVMMPGHGLECQDVGAGHWKDDKAGSLEEALRVPGRHWHGLRSSAQRMLDCNLPEADNAHVKCG